MFKVIFVFQVGLQSFLFTPAWCDDSTFRFKEPYLFPQTNFYIGNVDYSISLKNNLTSSTSRLDSGGSPNVFGFDLEVNQSSFFNIGAFFRVENQASDKTQTTSHQMAVLMGGFTRFFYTPPFLRSHVLPTYFFVRGDLGGGPTVLSGPSGMVLHMGLSVGIESYFSRWLGIGISYGYSFEYGRETLITGTGASGGFVDVYKDATIWNQGRVIAVSLKTTFF